MLWCDVQPRYSEDRKRKPRGSDHWKHRKCSELITESNIMNTFGHLSGSRSFLGNLTRWSKAGPSQTPNPMLWCDFQPRNSDDRKRRPRDSGHWKHNKCSELITEFNIMNTFDHSSGSRFFLGILIRWSKTIHFWKGKSHRAVGNRFSLRIDYRALSTDHAHPSRGTRERFPVRRIAA